MLPFEFTIKGPPVSSQTKNRQRLQQWKADVRQAAIARVVAGAVPVGIPVRISTTYYYEGDTPNVDNIIKPIQDALCGVVFVDDDQCQETKSRKRPLNGSYQIKGSFRRPASGIRLRGRIPPHTRRGVSSRRSTRHMKTTRVTAEVQRIRTLAREYELKGYRVVYPRDEMDLPFFLRDENYLPDLIVTSDKENLIIEVKTPKTVKRDRQISQISELVNRQPGWQFLFVLTRAKKDASFSSSTDSRRWQELLEKSRDPALAKPELNEAAFLLSWAALEGVIREAIASNAVPTEMVGTKAPMSLVRDAVIRGLIDRADVPRLEVLFQIRNELIHSMGGAKPSMEDVSMLQRLVDEIAINFSPK
jgi:crossover junction endodeoxyribonuclease RusA